MPDTLNDLSSHTNLDKSQNGIAYFPNLAHFLTFHVEERETFFEQWLDIVHQVKVFTAETTEGAVCICGVDYGLWQIWCDAYGMPSVREQMDVTMLDRVPFKNTAGDFWFHVKSDTPDARAQITDFIKQCFDGVPARHTETEAAKRPDGKVIADRFRDAMINPVDPVNFAERILVGAEDIDYEGSSFVLQQKFRHNWRNLDAMNMIEKENMIGRNHDNTIIPQHDDRSHIKCVRKLDGQRVTQRIMRQAVPYGHAPEGGGREEGIYFVAYSNAPEVFADLVTR